MNRLLTAALALALAACTAGGGVPQTPLLHADATRPTGELHWLASPGLGAATTSCGGEWTAVLGGAYSATATDVGSGYPGVGTSTWDAYSTNGKALIAAYALCGPTDGLGGFLYRTIASTTKKTPTTATASCNSGDMFLEGWTVYGTSGQPSVAKGTPNGWIAGGNKLVNAVAECATHREVVGTGMVYATKTADTGRLFVGCPSASDFVMGSTVLDTAAGGTGPEAEYPGLSNGSPSTDPTGVWFVNKPSSMTAWVACQQIP